MNPRNMVRNNNGMNEFEPGHQMQTQPHPEPYIVLGSTPNFPHSSVHQILPSSGSINTVDFQCLPEHHDGSALYRMPQQYPHQMGIPPPSNFYYPYLNPSPMDQLPSSSSFGGRAHVSGYGINGFIPEGLSKMNGPEGFMGNVQYFNAPAPSVSVPQMNVGHVDDRVVIIDACNPMPQYRGNYAGSTLPYNCPPISPYFEGSSVIGNSSELGNVGQQRFHEGASTSRGSLNHLPYTPMLHPRNEIHPRGSRYNSYHPLAATTSSRHLINNTRQYPGNTHPQQGPELVPPPSGIRMIYSSHRRSGRSEGVHRNHDLPHLRLLAEEGLAILEFSGHHEVVNTVDDHRDMRLDIDYMSYEELLALSERIGNVSTGLSEEDINTLLKTRVHRSSAETTTDLDQLPCIDDEKDSCVICQDEYEDKDNIGSLNCGHEYHTTCLKKWLPVKNECPICKAIALKVEHKSG